MDSPSTQTGQPATAATTEMEWYYFGDATCMVAGREDEKSSDLKRRDEAEGPPPKGVFLDQVLREVHGRLEEVLAPVQSAADGRDPKLIGIVRQLVARRGHWTHPWRRHLAVQIARMPETLPDGTLVPPADCILGPGRFVLPWPFPIRDFALHHRFHSKARARGLTFPVADYDAGQEVFLYSLMDVVEVLLVEEPTRLDGCGAGPATDQKKTQTAILTCAQEKAYDHLTLPPDMRFTILPDLPTNETRFRWDDVNGTLALHLVLGRQKQTKGLLLDKWPCG